MGHGPVNLRPYTASPACAVLAFIAMMTWSIATSAAPLAGDPHRNELGFFDIHVCNWPDRPRFFLTLFSTFHYDRVRSIRIYDPGGRPVGSLALDRYRVIAKKGKPEKRVFITNLPLPKEAMTGWYRAEVETVDGKRFGARDYVILEDMPRAAGLTPPDGASIPLPRQLTWDAVPGARHYKVIIKDLWDGERIILDSKLVTENSFTLPAGLLQPNGWYRWRVHARDTDEHALLGDFNHGSLSDWQEFTTRP